MNRQRFSLGLLLLLPLLFWTGCRIVYAISFDRQCGGRLKRAADANTIALATNELQAARAWIDANRATSGYTSILWTTPDEDVGYWHQNLKASLDGLLKIDETASSLEKSNVLIKLRETLLDQIKGESITVPNGISVFPNNVAWALFGTVATILGLAGVVLLFQVVVVRGPVGLYLASAARNR